MSPQQIISICEANCEAHKSDCSGFVNAVSAALGIATFNPDDNADSIMEKLRARNDWTALAAGDGRTAKVRADSGQFAVAGLK